MCVYCICSVSFLSDWDVENEEEEYYGAERNERQHQNMVKEIGSFFFNPGEQKQTLSTCNLEMQESCLQCWVLQGNSREPSAVLNLG